MEINSLESFLIGFLVGLVGMMIIFVQQLLKRNKLSKEIRSLRGHLQQKLEIESESLGIQRADLGKLKQENENLRITNNILLQKPGRNEVMSFHIYHKAVNILSTSFSGFGPAWQNALKQATIEVKSIEEGKSFLRRIPELIMGKSSSIDPPINIVSKSKSEDKT